MLFTILIFPLRSDIITARTRQPASVTPVLARATEVKDIIYTQPRVTRAQVSQGLGQRSLTHLEITNMRRDGRAVQWTEQTHNKEALTVNMAGGVTIAGPGEASERIVKKGLMWAQQDKLFSRWKEMMISVGDEMTLV